MVSNIVLSAVAWASNRGSSLMARIREEQGQDLIEYAMLVGGIAVVAAIALVAIGTNGAFTTFADKIQACVSFDTIGPATCG